LSTTVHFRSAFIRRLVPPIAGSDLHVDKLNWLLLKYSEKSIQFHG